MAEVIWSPQALDDLRAICQYIARDSERLAMSTATRIFLAADQLEEFPLSGRIVRERGREGFRELVVGSHRVIYTVDDPEHVSIVCLIHGRQQFPAGVAEQPAVYQVRRTLKDYVFAMPNVGRDSDFERHRDFGRSDPFSGD